MKRAFLSYLDDNDQKINGFVDILEFDKSFIKFQTDKNVITIPSSRILKLKEERDKNDRV